MLIAIPILSWIALAGILLLPGAGHCRLFRQALLVASAFWGGILLIITEALSLLEAFDATSLTVAWTITLLILAGIFAFRYRRFMRTRRSAPTQRNALPRISSFQRAAAYILIFQILLLAAVALHYRPNNYDSMTYHMTRVMQWKQNHSVRHFATGDIREIHHPPFAEYIIAHLQFLSGGDRFANLVQWFAMIQCVLALSLIASELGATGNGQIAASVLGTSIPMAVLQATSTQNDYVCGAWLCSFVYFGFRMIREAERPLWTVATGLTLGLGILTKPLAGVFGLPFCVWFGVSLIRREGWKGLRKGTLIAFLMLAVNLGHFARNWKLYGFIVSPRVSHSIGIGRISPAVMFANMIRFASLNVALEEPAGRVTGFMIHNLNEFNFWVLENLHKLTGLSPMDPSTNYSKPVPFKILGNYTHEDFAGSPFHLLLIIISVAVMMAGILIPGLQRPESAVQLYVAALIAAYCLFCIEFKWQLWGNRFLLPLVLLWCPAVIVLLLRREGRLALMVPILAGLLSFHWIIHNATRPLTASVFEPGRASAVNYFANYQDMEPVYRIMTQRIMKKGCHEIGLAIGLVPYDYPLWALFDEAGYPVTIRNVHADEESVRLLDPNFRPCAVIAEPQYVPRKDLPGLRFGLLTMYYPKEADSPR